MRSEKLIFHIDVNSAFLSWSALERLRGQPGSLDLRTVPSAVGGDEESRHGVVLAKRYACQKIWNYNRRASGSRTSEMSGANCRKAGFRSLCGTVEPSARVIATLYGCGDSVQHR